MKQMRFFIFFGVLLSTTLFSENYAANRAYYPVGYQIIERKGYTVAYDGKNRIPLWTQEHLTRENVSGKMERGSFKTDEGIYPLHRSTDDDYRGSGYSRGHMVPDADRDNSIDVLKEIYLFSNACPQKQSFNGGLWSELEDYVRDLVTDQDTPFESVDVITGPLFLPVEDGLGNRKIEYPLIGENDVAVPTHFFKVLYKHTRFETTVEVFLMPTSAHKDDNLTDYHVSIEDLERVSGLRFYHLS